MSPICRMTADVGASQYLPSSSPLPTSAAPPTAAWSPTAASSQPMLYQLVPVGAASANMVMLPMGHPPADSGLAASLPPGVPLYRRRSPRRVPYEIPQRSVLREEDNGGAAAAAAAAPSGREQELWPKAAPAAPQPSERVPPPAASSHAASTHSAASRAFEEEQQQQQQQKASVPAAPHARRPLYRDPPPELQDTNPAWQSAGARGAAAITSEQPPGGRPAPAAAYDVRGVAPQPHQQPGQSYGGVKGAAPLSPASDAALFRQSRDRLQLASPSPTPSNYSNYSMDSSKQSSVFSLAPYASLPAGISSSRRGAEDDQPSRPMSGATHGKDGDGRSEWAAAAAAEREAQAARGESGQRWPASCFMLIFHQINYSPQVLNALFFIS